jgi:hypothetical protein
MPTNSHTVTITLTREQRDALYQEADGIVGTARELPTLDDAAFDLDEREVLRDRARRLWIGVRLLDQLGWHEHSDQDVHELDVDEEIAHFLANTEARALADLAARRRDADDLVDLDLDILNAAGAAHTAYRKAVA